MTSQVPGLLKYSARVETAALIFRKDSSNRQDRFVLDAVNQEVVREPMYHKVFCRQFSRIFRIAIIAAACFTFMATAGHAATNPDESTRPLKVKVAPEYPELAKRMNMKGSVRLELLIAPDGRVKDTKVLGGNPVLVQAAEDAARKWRYAPAEAESKVIVKFDFDPLMGK